MAVIAGVATGDMVGRFALCGGSVVATCTACGDAIVIEFGITPTIGRMTVIAGVATGYMVRGFSFRSGAIVTVGAVANHAVVVNP